MLILYQFAPCWSLPSASPFCIKLETWLRIAGLPFAIKTLADPRKAPKGKLPFIEDKGKTLADSTFIIHMLKQRYNIKLDEHLNQEQQAVSLALQSLMEDHLYWVIVYGRWMDPAGWALTRSAYFGHLPPLIRSTVPVLVRSSIRKTLWHQGTGRHSAADIYHLGQQDISALARHLGDQSFFLGAQATTIDAIAFAFITSIINCPVETPLKAHASQYDNLKRYCQHIQKTWYR
jgi:glutathione S-transferase